ncbi:MAG: hypothetical protein WC477_05945 [Patescibacteria group bacterium]
MLTKNWVLKTAITTEPIEVDTLKEHIHIDSDDEEMKLATLLLVAREFGEMRTGFAFAPQTWYLYLNDFPAEDYILWDRGPLTSVTSVKYTNSAGTETTMTVTTDYLVDANVFPGKIYLPYGKTWPSFTPYPYNAVKIEGVCGYSGTVPYVLPKNYEQAMLLHAGLMYKKRDLNLTPEEMSTIFDLYDLEKLKWVS